MKRGRGVINEAAGRVRTTNTLFSQKCERVKLLSVSLRIPPLQQRRRGGATKKMGDCWEKRRREKTNSLSKLPRAFKRTEEDTELGGL